MAGTKQDGSTFSIPDIAFDCPTIGRCGQFDQDNCTEMSGPRSPVFMCDALQSVPIDDESTLPTGLSSWFLHSDFPGAVASALHSQFPGAIGIPIILGVGRSAFVSGVGSVQPTIADYCITGAFVDNGRGISDGTGFGEIGETPSTVTLGDCAEDCCNGIDDDGDGKVDFADSDCCAAPPATEQLTVRSVSLKPSKKLGATAGSARLKIELPAGTSGFAAADPTVSGASFQIADATGGIACATLPAATWTHPKPVKPLFKSKGETAPPAGGFTKGVFRAPSGTAGKGVFSAKDKSIDLSELVAGDATLRLRIGNQCATGAIQLIDQKGGFSLP
jgi:hypothetical protein